MSKARRMDIIVVIFGRLARSDKWRKGKAGRTSGHIEVV